MLLNVHQLERDSGVSRFTWRSWIRQKRLAHVRLGRRVLVDEQDYRQFISAHRTPATENGKASRGRGRA